MAGLEDIPDFEMSFTLEQIGDASSHLLSYLSHSKLVLFQAEMGSGKTTLIKELCRSLGSMDEFSSPTFSIVNEYETDHDERIYHIDLYRIEREEELYDIDFHYYLSEANYCFIEWPAIGQNFYPEHFVLVKMEKIDQQTRKLAIFKV